MSSQLQLRPSPADFYFVPSLNASLFQVKAGAPSAVALATTHCLVESLDSMAKAGIEGGIDPSSAYAMHVMLEMVYGLLKSLEVAQ